MRTEALPQRADSTHVNDNTGEVAHSPTASTPPLVQRACAVAVGAVLLLPAIAFAQSPWEQSANALKSAFTGTIAHALAPVAIIVGGLMWMFGEGGARRHIAALIMGGGMVLAATAFSTWLFGTS